MSLVPHYQCSKCDGWDRGLLSTTSAGRCTCNDETPNGEKTMQNEPFKPASNGSGKRHWGAARFGGREWAEDRRGRIIRVASYDAAVRLAERANKKERTNAPQSR